MGRGLVSGQVIEIAREKIDSFSQVYYGEITYQIRFGKVYRVITRNEHLVDSKKTPKAVLQNMSKEELIKLILNKV